jgi:[ribosomal protein S18]-alanine N-acetyltransferase
MSGSLLLAPLGALTLDVAAALHREAFTPFGERAWTRQDIAELMASPGVAGVLLTCDGASAGFGLYRVVADEAELLTIAVAASHRRRGLATRILNAIIEGIGENVRSLYLEVAVDNAPARALYERLGFEEVGRRARYYRRAQGEMADALILRLRLDG